MGNWLEIRNLEVRLPGSDFHLGPLSLSVADDTQALGVMGRNGSGKTTLLSALLGQRKDSGEVLWWGEPVDGMHRRELARKVALFPQVSNVLPHFSVEEYVRLGTYARGGSGWFYDNGSPARREVRETLSRLGVLELADRPVRETSGGELQRVKLARALVQQPEVLLLDEPDAFLDPAARRELTALLRSLKQSGLRMVLTSHDDALVRELTDRLVLLEDGELVREGVTGELANSPAFQQFWENSTEATEHEIHV